MTRSAGRGGSVQIAGKFASSGGCDEDSKDSFELLEEGAHPSSISGLKEGSKHSERTFDLDVNLAQVEPWQSSRGEQVRHRCEQNFEVKCNIY